MHMVYISKYLASVATCSPFMHRAQLEYFTYLNNCFRLKMPDITKWRYTYYISIYIYTAVYKYATVEAVYRSLCQTKGDAQLVAVRRYSGNISNNLFINICFLQRPYL